MQISWVRSFLFLFFWPALVGDCVSYSWKLSTSKWDLVPFLLLGERGDMGWWRNRAGSERGRNLKSSKRGEEGEGSRGGRGGGGDWEYGSVKTLIVLMKGKQCFTWSPRCAFESWDMRQTKQSQRTSRKRSFQNRGQTKKLNKCNKKFRVTKAGN